MPRQYGHGGRVSPRGGGPGATDGTPGDGRAPRSLRQRWSALANLRPFLRLVWQIHPGMAAGTLLLRLLRAVLPVATLYVGKLIVDEVVRLSGLAGRPAGAQLGAGCGGRSTGRVKCGQRSEPTLGIRYWRVI